LGLGNNRSPAHIEVELINTVLTTSAQAPAADQPQIEQPLQDPETTLRAVLGSTSTIQGLKRGEIIWNGTPGRETSSTMIKI
jgi:hypothetical protein